MSLRTTQGVLAAGSLKDSDKNKFQKVQSEFINQLRKELSIKGEIDFETFVIPVTQEEIDACIPKK